MVKGLDHAPKLWIKKHGKTTGKKFSGLKMTKEKPEGVKVQIHTTDLYGQPIEEYGYILRRLNVDTYEINGETTDIVYTLNRTEFTEISETNR